MFLEKHMKKAIHVLQRGRKWVVKTAGAQRVAKVCDDRDSAIERGKQMARAKRTVLIVHRPDGSIRSKDSFNNRKDGRWAIVPQGEA